MKPAVTTRAGATASICAARATSHSARDGKSAGRQTNVGMPARSARSIPDARAVGADGDDAGAVGRVDGRVEQRLQEGSRAGDEDEDAGSAGVLLHGVAAHEAHCSAAPSARTRTRMREDGCGERASWTPPPSMPGSGPAGPCRCRCSCSSASWRMYLPAAQAVRRGAAAASWPATSRSRLLRFLAGRPGRQKVWPAITLGIIGRAARLARLPGGRSTRTVTAYEHVPRRGPDEPGPGRLRADRGPRRRSASSPAQRPSRRSPGRSRRRRRPPSRPCRPSPSVADERPRDASTCSRQRRQPTHPSAPTSTSAARARANGASGTPTAASRSTPRAPLPRPARTATTRHGEQPGRGRGEETGAQVAEELQLLVDPSPDEDAGGDRDEDDGIHQRRGSPQRPAARRGPGRGASGPAGPRPA